MDAVTVADHGHAPLLTGPDLTGRIAQFVASCDQAKSPRVAPAADVTSGPDRR
jgi:hypothetical protein